MISWKYSRKISCSENYAHCTLKTYFGAQCAVSRGGGGVLRLSSLGSARVRLPQRGGRPRPSPCSILPLQTTCESKLLQACIYHYLSGFLSLSRRERRPASTGSPDSVARAPCGAAVPKFQCWPFFPAALLWEVSQPSKIAAAFCPSCPSCVACFLPYFIFRPRR